MARISRRLQDKHNEFREEFDDIWAATADERRQAVEDRRFCTITGAQWEDQYGEQFANMPRFEANKLHASVIKIYTEYRNNRITVDFRPKDKESSVETAETLTGRYRADEQESTAREAYDNAFDEGVTGGIGAWRLRVVNADDEDADTYNDETSDPDDEDQKLRCNIEPIYDADSSVFWDLDAKRQDKADATRCYIITSITRRAYEVRYGKKYSLASWPVSKMTTGFDWATPDVVYIAEVYEVERFSGMLHVYRSNLTEEVKELDDEDIENEELMSELKALNFIHVRDCKVRQRRVCKYLMNGAQIMGGMDVISGKCIPVVPYYGKRWFIDNIERTMGHVRLGKDMQRLLNMLISKLGEIAGLSPNEVPILTPQQVAGHENSWANGNIERKAYRLVNPPRGPNGEELPSRPMEYLKPPEVPPTLATLATVASGTLDQLQGSNPEQDEMVSNISAKAVELIQTRIDMKSFIYTENMAVAMRRSGQIWLSIQKDICPDEEHDAAILKPDGTQDFVRMKTKTIDKVTGATISLNDPSDGRYGVWSDVGPSFNSKRDATVRALMQILGVANPQDQQLATILISTAIMNMDGEGLGDIRDFMRKKLVAMGAAKPTDEEAKQLAEAKQNEKPDPQTAFLMAEADKSTKLGQKALADSLLSLAKVAQTRATADRELAEARKLIAETHGVNIDTTLMRIQATNDAQAQAAAPTAGAPSA